MKFKTLFQTMMMIFLIGQAARIDICRASDINLFAGAGLRQPVDHLVQAFEAETGHRVFVEYGGSGKLMVRIRTLGKGDLFIPGALFYIDILEQEGIVVSYTPIVAHTPVVGINRKSKINCRTFADIATPGFRLALGDPQAMALGKNAMAILECTGLKDAVLKNVVVYGATVKQLALYVSNGEVDGAIIGRADAVQFNDTIRIVPVPENCLKPEMIAVGMLKTGAMRSEVHQLQQYLSSEHAIAIFQTYGFLPIDVSAHE